MFVLFIKNRIQFDLIYNFRLNKLSLNINKKLDPLFINKLSSIFDFTN